MPQLLAVASRMARPAERDDAETGTLIGAILALPARTSGELEGAAILAGYRIGLERCSKKLVTLAVTRALQDPERRFRPSPNELLAYVEPEMAAIRRRLHRLESLKRNPARDPAAEAPQITPEQQEEVRLRMEELARKFGAKQDEARAQDEANRGPTILAAKEPDVPRVETLMAAHGIDRESAAARVAEILSKRGVV